MRKISLISIFAFLFSIHARAAESDDAIADVMNYASGLIQASMLPKSERLNGNASTPGVCNVIKNGTDFEALVAFTGGSLLQNASTEDRALFANAFQGYLANTLTIYIESYLGDLGGDDVEDAKITATEITAGKILVELALPKQSLSVRFLTQNLEGKYVVLDHIFNGISFAELQRSEFSSASRGSLGKLISKIQKKNASNYGNCK